MKISKGDIIWIVIIISLPAIINMITHIIIMH